MLGDIAKSVLKHYWCSQTRIFKLTLAFWKESTRDVIAVGNVSYVWKVPNHICPKETSITLLDQSDAELCLAKDEGGGRTKREMGTAP